MFIFVTLGWPRMREKLKLNLLVVSLDIMIKKELSIIILPFFSNFNQSGPTCFKKDFKK